MKHVPAMNSGIVERAMIGGHLDLPGLPEGVTVRTGEAAMTELWADLEAFLAEVPLRLRPGAIAKARKYSRIVAALLALHPQAALCNDKSRGFRITRREEGYAGSGSLLAIEHHVILPQSTGGYLYADVALDISQGQVDVRTNCWRESFPADIPAPTGYNRRDDERVVACSAAIKAYMADIAA
ncbi:MAG: hypothetical protein JWO93_2741 [Micrococcaceae bacterium]|jgi:hypothetical protein|nr:hypothetical protein [Micrococcaceae bacterium]